MAHNSFAGLLWICLSWTFQHKISFLFFPEMEMQLGYFGSRFVCVGITVFPKVFGYLTVWQMSAVTGGQQGHLHWGTWGRISSVKCQSMGFPGGASGKEPTCQCERHETQVSSLDEEDPLEKGMATHSGIFAWEIPWTEEPGTLQSIGSPRVRQDRSDFTAHALTGITLSLHYVASFYQNPVFTTATKIAHLGTSQNAEGNHYYPKTK